MAKAKKRPDRDKAFKKFAERSPEMTVLTDHPLKPQEASGDNFNLRYRMGPIYDIVRYPGTRTPMAIAVYGDWGAGKTTAMKWLHGLIEQWNETGQADNKIKVRPVWFYPWKYDSKEDVWRGLISEVIINSIDVKGASLQTVKDAAKRFGLFLGKSFLHTLAAVTLKTPGGTAELDLAAIKEILAEYRNVAHPEKAYLNEFESSLREWVERTLGENERMVVFVDDLDRCMPDIALQVLEALKLYLNIEKLIFVVGVDKNVVDKLVKEHYKKLGLDEGKSKNYLAKMFQVEVQVEPTEQQISDFLKEQLGQIPYWSDNLSPDEQTLFGDLVFNLAERNPREVKRLLNSALMVGAGAMMLQTDAETSGIQFNQGLQLFFVRKILEDRFTMGSLLGTKRGNEFFSQWSKIVWQGREKDPEFPCCVKIPYDFGKTVSKEGPDVQRVESIAPISEGERWLRDALAAGDDVVDKKTKGKVDLSFAPQQYHPLLRNTLFSGLLHLLADDYLGRLMQIPYPAEVIEVAAVVGVSKDEEIIREAIARQLSKKPEELATEDYDKITELNLYNTPISNIEPIQMLSNLQTLYLSATQVSNIEPLGGLSNLQTLGLDSTQVSDIEPLKGLSKLQTLALYGTQVSNIEPLKMLSNLQELYLYGTQVSEEQIAELKNALPKLEIYR